MKMGFFGRWSTRTARRVSSQVSRIHRIAWKKSKKKYTTRIKEKWSSQFKGKGTTKEQKTEFIERVSEELTTEILVEVKKESRELDPTGEAREVIKADIMREVAKIVDAAIVSGKKLKPNGLKMTDPQPDIP